MILLGMKRPAESCWRKPEAAAGKPSLLRKGWLSTAHPARWNPASLLGDLHSRPVFQPLLAPATTTRTGHSHVAVCALGGLGEATFTRDGSVDGAPEDTAVQLPSVPCHYPRARGLQPSPGGVLAVPTTSQTCTHQLLSQGPRWGSVGLRLARPKRVFWGLPGWESSCGRG